MRDLRTVYTVDPEPCSWRSCGYYLNVGTSYETLVETLEVEVLLQEDEVGWEGDSLMLLRDRFKRDRFGLLTFGWGSCSGCDALQACETYEDLEALRDALARGIVWGDRATLATYLNDHDWEASFLDDDLVAAFVPQALATLEIA